MDHVQKAVTLFKEGGNCSQAVLYAYADDFGLDAETALKLASGFGGGIGRMGDLCGALTGALMVLGLRYGSADIHDKSGKLENYRKAKRLAEEFKLQTGSMHCRELLGFDMSQPEGELAAKKPGAFHECPEYVRIAAELLEAMLK